MKLHISQLSILALTFLLWSCKSNTEFSQFSKSLKEAKQLLVYEGLPHQFWETELLAKEKAREDVTEIGDFPFYTPGVSPEKSVLESLRELLSSPDSVKPYTGPKKCGGFHPDFAISWSDGKTEYTALICFGCFEIKILLPNETLHYDIENKAHENLKIILSGFKLKRPEKKQLN